MGDIRGKADGIGVNTIETYPISYVEQLFSYGQTTHDDVCKVYEVVISCLPLRAIWLITSLWAVTLHRGNYGTEYKPRNHNVDGDVVYEARKCRDGS